MLVAGGRGRPTKQAGATVDITGLRGCASTPAIAADTPLDPDAAAAVRAAAAFAAAVGSAPVCTCKRGCRDNAVKTLSSQHQGVDGTIICLQCPQTRIHVRNRTNRTNRTPPPPRTVIGTLAGVPAKSARARRRAVARNVGSPTATRFRSKRRSAAIPACGVVRKCNVNCSGNRKSRRWG